MMKPDPRRTDLAEFARQIGYEPPQLKYESDQGANYLGTGIDYYQLLLDPRRTALLVIDMQNIFVRPGMASAIKDAEALISTINALAATFRELDQPIIWTVWCHRADGSNLGRNSVFWRDIVPLPADSDLAQIHPDLHVRDDDIVLTKPNYNAFWATDLGTILSTQAIGSLVFTGVATDICVEQTLIDAFHRDFSCVVVADGTATSTPYQAETLWMDENYWARVLTADEVKHELRTLVRHREHAGALDER